MEPNTEPPSRPSAPGSLALVEAFLNTNNLLVGRDDLRTPALLRLWLEDRDLIAEGEGVGAEDLRRAHEVREALRSLVARNGGGRLDPTALQTLNQAAARSPFRTYFDLDGRVRHEPQASGVDRSLGHLLAAVREAMEAGTWGRLKVCHSATCRWAFYDYSRNRSGVWCTMDVCGNRSKARAYQRRKRAGGHTRRE